MNRPHNSKTAPVPHRVINKTSIYLARQQKVDRNDFLGFEAVVDLDDNQSITIQSSSALDPRDGRVFDYVSSQWFATKKKQGDLKEMEVEIPLIIEALGLSNRTENRKNIIKHLKNMLGITVAYSWVGGEILFHMLETVKIIDGTNTISIKISETYEEALQAARSRYINVDQTMGLKGAYAIELSKLLQAKGAGVSKSGDPKPPKEISHSEICNYIHLEDGTKRAADEVRRAFKELEGVGYPSYSYGGGREIWKKIEKSEIQKS